MIKGRLNLQALKHVKMEVNGKSGKVKGVFIPLEVNNIFEGEKGLYLDLVAFELKEAKNNQTHMVKQSFSKDIREKMSDDEKKNQPILGSLNVGGFQNTESNGDVFDGKIATPDDDLPF